MLPTIIRHHFETIDSTNSWAKQNASTFSRDGFTIVTAKEQTAGRGRNSNTWISLPDQNIHLTFAFFASPQATYIANIPQVLAISATKCLEQLEFTPKIKWPNDLLLSGKKIAGILTETIQIDSLVCIVVGIGININTTQTQLQQINRPTTSLYVESNKLFDIDSIIEKLIGTFIPDCLSLIQKDTGFKAFLPNFEQRLCYQKGDLVQFKTPSGPIEGKFDSIRENGSLDLLMNSGEVRNFISITS